MNNLEYYKAELLKRIMGYDPVLNLSTDYELIPREPSRHLIHTRTGKYLTLTIENTRDTIRIIITDEYGSPYVIRSWHVIYDNESKEYAKVRSE